MTSEDSDQWTQELLAKIKKLRAQVFDLSEQCEFETVEESLLQSVDCLDEAINDLENRIEENLIKKESAQVCKEIDFENKLMGCKL